MLYLILRYIIRYRLKVVKDNIARSFPEKSKEEQAKIINNFYHHLAHQIIESFCFILISEKEIKRRFVFDNVELLEHFANKGRNMTAVIGHYGNWDWIASIPLWSNKFITGTLYKRIKNKFFNNLFLKIRGRFGVHCIEMKQAFRGLIELNKKEKPNIIAYIADQNTTRKNVHYWVNFLNQDTAVQSGWATIARRFDTVVLYLKITPIKRGYYSAKIEVITEDPCTMSEQELLEAYMSRLERDIKERPEFWLWTHKRWKHKRVRSEE